MIIIDTYTASWDEAMRPTAPRIGSVIRMHEQPDDREADAFQRCLQRAGLDLEFICHHPRLRMDAWRIVRA